MTSKPATIEEPKTTAVAEWEDPDLAEFGENDPGRFPEMKIIQKAVPGIPNSGKHSGEFYRSDIEEFNEAPEGSFVAYARTQSFFDKDGNLICRSDDGIRPVPGGKLWGMETVTLKDGTEIAGGAMEPRALYHERGDIACADCPFRKNGCKFSYAAYMVDDEDYLLRVRFKGTGVMPFSEFLNDFKPKALRWGKGGGGRPIFSKRVRLTTKEAQEGDRLWYEPRIEVLGENPPDQKNRLMEIARYVRHRLETGRETAAEVVPDEPAQANGGWETGAPPIDGSFDVVED